MVLLQDVRLLGNRALSGGVFQYIRCLLDSPFFSRERVSIYIHLQILCHSVSLISRWVGHVAVFFMLSSLWLSRCSVTTVSETVR